MSQPKWKRPPPRSIKPPPDGHSQLVCKAPGCKRETNYATMSTIKPGVPAIPPRRCTWCGYHFNADRLDNRRGRGARMPRTIDEEL